MEVSPFAPWQSFSSLAKRFFGPLLFFSQFWIFDQKSESLKSSGAAQFFDAYHFGESR
jgi:hypothetical protein